MTRSGKRFRQVLTSYYPWAGESATKDECTRILYESARNPLVHSLGLDEKPPTTHQAEQIVLLKSPLTTEQILELEENASRPTWLQPTITHVSPLAYGATELGISVPTLYWGVHRMLHSLFADPHQASQANALAKAYSPLWHKTVSDTARGTDEVKVRKEPQGDH